VLNLKKYLAKGDIVVPMDEIQLDDKLHMIEEPVKVVDREVKRLKKSRIPIVKVSWNSQRGPEFTWEREDQIKKKCPHLFTKLIRDTTEKIVQIKNCLLTARSFQKSYADRRTKPLEFEVSDMVLLNVWPWKGAVRFGKCGKLSPHYIGPFKILARVGPVAYTLELPEDLKGAFIVLFMF
nr:reverse transcriptase domain-containing protein [Tanacetum cinerariifolium]